jgi:hypothetical protein
MAAALRTRLFWIASISLALTHGALAQEGGGLPTFTGNGSVTQALNTDTGALFDLGSGITMMFPKGLPVGRSRLVTLKKATKKPSASEIKKGFAPLGVPLDFSTPLSAGGKAMEVAIAVKNDPRKPGHKLVLAMEIGTLCDEKHKSKLKNGLCSGWEFSEAEYDGTGRRLVAKLQSTGGLRMVFGLLPDEA